MRRANSRRILRHLAAAALLAGALSSSAPVARWCSMPWDHVPAALYLRCSLFSDRGVTRFALAPSQEEAVCPLARAAGAPTGGGECGAGRCGAARCPKAASEPVRDRAYCLSDPGLASVWRPGPPALGNPAPAVAVPAAAPALPAPASALARSRGLESDARPPGAEPGARPPVRAPPPLPSNA